MVFTSSGLRSPETGHDCHVFSPARRRDPHRRSPIGDRALVGKESAAHDERAVIVESIEALRREIQELRAARPRDDSGTRSTT
jgi:ribosomal protein L19E